MTDSASDLYEDTVPWAEEPTQNTEATDVQSASVADYRPVDAHVKGKLAGEDGLRKEDVLAEGEETPVDGGAGVVFTDFSLSEEILDAMTRMSSTTLTPIQAEAIPALLELNDVIDTAQTETGKTAVFTLPMLAIADAQEREIRVLVLAPTRGLAMQSAQAIDDPVSMARGLGAIPVYGGSPYDPQIPVLKRGTQVVVGTPGHIIDLIERGTLDLFRIRMPVLDEADEMLRMGFVKDAETIAASAPEDHLAVFSSATTPPAIERIASTHLRNPVRAIVSEESSVADTIHQIYAVVPFKHKLGALTRVLATCAQHTAEEQEDADTAIVFVRTRVDVGKVSLEMSTRDFRAAGISGDVAQTERGRMVERLRAGTPDVLVVTDVAAHGLDVGRISFVMDFDIPREPETYVHHIGRTGHAGREGRSLTLFTPRERGRLRRIEKLTGTRMEEVQIPSPVAILGFCATCLFEGLNARVEKGRLELYKRLLGKASEEGDNSILDLVAALMANAVGDDGPKPHIVKDSCPKRSKDEGELDESDEFLGISFEGRDKDRPSKTSWDPSRRRAPESLGSVVCYRAEVGKKDHVKPGSTVDAIVGEGGVEGRNIRRIEILPNFSLVEIPGELSEDQLSQIGKDYVQSRLLCIRADEEPGKGRTERARSFGKVRRFDRSERERAKREYPRRYERHEGFIGADWDRDHDGPRGLKDHKRHADQGAERSGNQHGIRGGHASSRFRDEERRERFDRDVSQRRFSKKDYEKRGGREFGQRDR